MISKLQVTHAGNDQVQQPPWNSDQSERLYTHVHHVINLVHKKKKDKVRATQIQAKCKIVEGLSKDLVAGRTR